MRERSARALAAATGVLLLGAVILFAALREDRGPEPQPGSALVQDADSLIMSGRAVYDELGCAGCHSIAGEGSPRSPLDGVGARLSAEEIRLWIVDPQAARPGIRKPAFDDVPDPDVEALVVYLQTLT
jgi:mono/diheme cytochrome c family protein